MQMLMFMCVYVYFSFYIKIFLEFFSRQIHSCFFFLFMFMSSVHVRLHISVFFFVRVYEYLFRGCVVDAFCN